MRSRMSLIPKLVSHWWETLEHPHRLLDQHFGKHLRPDDFFRSSVVDQRFPFFDTTLTPQYFRPWADLMRDEQNGGWSVVKTDKDKFHVVLDVVQFKPEEITVKVVDNYIIIEGKHEEKPDEHGIISRQFVRKYLVPEQCDPEKTSSTISSDGVLTITAPRKPISEADKQERVIKVEHTGKPSMEKKREEKEQDAKQ